MGDRATLRQDVLQWLDTPIDLERLAAANPFPDVRLAPATDPLGRPAIRIVCTMPDSADVAHHPFQAEIDELVACVLEGRDTSIDVFEAQKTMEVCLAADRSAELGGTAGCAAVDRRLTRRPLNRRRAQPFRTTRPSCGKIFSSRRDFLKSVAGAAATAPIMLRAQNAGPRTVAPNDRIRFAAIGVGIRGQQDLRSALRTPGVELVAAADVYDGRLTLAKELLGQPAVHDARLSRGAGAARRRRRDHRDAGSLAYADRARRDEGGQGRLRREADGAGARRRSAHHRRRAADRPHPPGRQPARQLDRLREGEGAVPRRRDRRAEPRRSVDQPQLRDGRLAVFDSAGRLAADHRLGSVPRPRAETAVRAGAPVPLAQLPRLRHRHSRRSVRAPVHRDPLRARRARADARDRERRPPPLERRPRRARRHARAVRLSEDGVASGVHLVAEGELRRRRRRRTTCSASSDPKASSRLATIR